MVDSNMSAEATSNQPATIRRKPAIFTQWLPPDCAITELVATSRAQNSTVPVSEDVGSTALINRIQKID
jgi:hypothetical protein